MIKKRIIGLFSSIILSTFLPVFATQPNSQQEKDIEELAKKNGVTKEQMTKIINDQVILKKSQNLPQELLDKIADEQIEQVKPQKVVFQCPTAEIIKEYAQKLPDKYTWSSDTPLFTYTNPQGVIFKDSTTSIPKPTNSEVTIRARNLSEHHGTYFVWGQPNQKHPRIMCGYSLKGGTGIELTVDFKAMGLQDTDQVIFDKRDLINTAPGYGWTPSNSEITLLR